MFFLSLPGIKATRESNKFVTLLYCKPIFSSVFKNYESFVLDIYKRRPIETLLHRNLDYTLVL